MRFSLRDAQQYTETLPPCLSRSLRNIAKPSVESLELSTSEDSLVSVTQKLDGSQANKRSDSSLFIFEWILPVIVLRR